MYAYTSSSICCFRFSVPLSNDNPITLHPHFNFTPVHLTKAYVVCHITSQPSAEIRALPVRRGTHYAHTSPSSPRASSDRGSTSCSAGRMRRALARSTTFSALEPLAAPSSSLSVTTCCIGSSRAPHALTRRSQAAPRTAQLASWAALSRREHFLQTFKLRWHRLVTGLAQTRSPRIDSAALPFLLAGGVFRNGDEEYMIWPLFSAEDAGVLCDILTSK